MVFEKYFQRYLHCQHYNLTLLIGVTLHCSYTIFWHYIWYINHNYYNGQRSLVTINWLIYKLSVLTLSQFFETLMCWFWFILNIKFLWHLTYHKLMTLWEQSRTGQSPPVLPPLNWPLCHVAWLNTGIL